MHTARTLFFMGLITAPFLSFTQSHGDGVKQIEIPQFLKWEETESERDFEELLSEIRLDLSSENGHRLSKTVRYQKSSGELIEFYRDYCFEDGGYHRVKFNVGEVHHKPEETLLP